MAAFAQTKRLTPFRPPLITHLQFCYGEVSGEAEVGFKGIKCGYLCGEDEGSNAFDGIEIDAIAHGVGAIGETFGVFLLLFFS